MSYIYYRTLGMMGTEEFTKSFRTNYTDDQIANMVAANKRYIFNRPTVTKLKEEIREKQYFEANEAEEYEYLNSLTDAQLSYVVDNGKIDFVELKRLSEMDKDTFKSLIEYDPNYVYADDNRIWSSGREDENRAMYYLSSVEYQIVANNEHIGLI